MHVIRQMDVEEKIIEIRNQKVIIDFDVADLYGVDTKRINEAVKNNPKKFPIGYLIELTYEEKTKLVEIFDQFDKLKHSPVLPKAFTERGLYMLATILKSQKAIDTTLAIIDTFTKVRELGQVIKLTQTLPKNSPKQKTLVEQAGDLVSELILPDDNGLTLKGTETTFEMNFAVFKIKRTIKKSK